MHSLGVRAGQAPLYILFFIFGTCFYQTISLFRTSAHFLTYYSSELYSIKHIFEKCRRSALFPQKLDCFPPESFNRSPMKFASSKQHGMHANLARQLDGSHFTVLPAAKESVFSRPLIISGFHNQSTSFFTDKEMGGIRARKCSSTIKRL